jgi:Tol biopolymer transport system component
MGVDLAEHSLFTAWRDPQSGVTSHILTHRVADVQMGFYFTNRSLETDGQHLWFYCANPPSPYKCLGVVSLRPDADPPRIFHRTHFQSESPMVETDGRSAFFTSVDSVFKVDLDGNVSRIITLPGELVGRRPVRRMTTHLTRSADRKYLLLDGQIAETWHVGVGEIETGAFRLLTEFPRQMNHAQFSPVDPNLFSIAMDWYVDPISTHRFDFTHRIWLMDLNGRYDAVHPKGFYGRDSRICHEWWSPDGRLCWVHYEQGIFEHDLATGETAQVYSGPVCHAHTNHDRSAWVWDESPYKWKARPCEVMFLNRATGKKIAIASALPQPPVSRHPWHIDPHPHFSGDGQWVVYTTTVRGQVDVALVSVEQLLAHTQ